MSGLSAINETVSTARAFNEELMRIAVIVYVPSPRLGNEKFQFPEISVGVYPISVVLTKSLTLIFGCDDVPSIISGMPLTVPYRSAIGSLMVIKSLPLKIVVKNNMLKKGIIIRFFLVKCIVKFHVYMFNDVMIINYFLS